MPTPPSEMPPSQTRRTPRARAGRITSSSDADLDDAPLVVAEVGVGGDDVGREAGLARGAHEAFLLVGVGPAAAAGQQHQQAIAARRAAVDNRGDRRRRRAQGLAACEKGQGCQDDGMTRAGLARDAHVLVWR